MDVIVSVEDVKKTYRKRRSKEVVQAVKGVSFSVNRGEILGLLGPNGAGKSSIIKMICGLLIPDSGSITINGNNNRDKRLHTLRDISAVLEGNRNIYWRLTVRENLEYFAGNRGLSRKEIASDIEKLLIQFNLKDKENELVNSLSRGMQQKLAIAVAMLADSEVVLLDEPTLGLDVETSYEIRELLRDMVDHEQRTIIISSHDMAVVQDLCERAIIINEGQIVTNDHIENLMRLFETRSYTITLGDLLIEEQLDQLKEKFPLHSYSPDSYESTLTVDLAKSEEIYELFNVLQLNHTPVESIDRRTINFEQVFMEIVKGGNGHVMDQSS